MCSNGFVLFFCYIEESFHNLIQSLKIFVTKFLIRMRFLQDFRKCYWRIVNNTKIVFERRHFIFAIRRLFHSLFQMRFRQQIFCAQFVVLNPCQITPFIVTSPNFCLKFADLLRYSSFSLLYKIRLFAYFCPRPMWHTINCWKELIFIVVLGTRVFPFDCMQFCFLLLFFWSFFFVFQHNLINRLFLVLQMHSEACLGIWSHIPTVVS